MPEQNFNPVNPSFDRPSARFDVNGSVVQRGNYGVPPRQPVATMPSSPAGTSSTLRPIQDFGPPRPSQPIAATPTAVTVASPPNTPMMPPTQVAQPQPAMFEALRQSAKAPDPEEAHRLALIGAKLWIVGLIIGTLLLVGGAAKLLSAGSTAGERIAVGAVVLNDGHKTTIQFTADDGLLHHFTVQQSQKDQIPGTAVQLAYQPGAAEATVKQVAAVQSARGLGNGLLAGGILLIVLSGLLKLIQQRFRRVKQRSQSQPVRA